MTKTEQKSRDRAVKHHARLVKIATERLGLLRTAEDLDTMSDKAQCNVLAAASRYLTNRIGQGHSR